MLKRIKLLGIFFVVASCVYLLNLPNGPTPARAIFNGGSFPTQSLGYQQYTSLSSATALSNVPAGAWYVLITVEGAGIRWRDDGTNPTASVGMPVSSGSSFVYTGSFAKFTVIQQTSGAIINVAYYQ